MVASWSHQGRRSPYLIFYDRAFPVHALLDHARLQQDANADEAEARRGKTACQEALPKHVTPQNLPHAVDIGLVVGMGGEEALAAYGPEPGGAIWLKLWHNSVCISYPQ